MTALFTLEPFGGTRGENISVFLRKLELCLKPDLQHYDESEHDEVKLMVLECNLRGEAREFYDEQPAGVRESWDAMCKKLSDHFHMRFLPNRATIYAMQRLARLNQGKKSLGEYVAAAKQIHAALPKELKPRLQDVMCSNLADPAKQAVILRILEMYRISCPQNEELNFDQFCRLLYLI